MNPRDKLSVLFLSSWYPNRLLPKNGNFVQKHAQAVARIAKVASLHVISDANAKDFEIHTEQKKGVYEVLVYYPKSAKWRALKKYRMYMEAHRRGYAYIQAEWGSVDITHLHVIYPAGLFAMELKKKYNIPFVLTEHWTAWLPITPYKFSAIERYFIRKIGAKTAIFCPVSEDLQNAFVHFGFDGPFRIIPNVVDIDTFKLGTRNLDALIKILHVSTFKDDHKNISGILRVIARLQEQRNDFEVTMVGNKFGDQYDEAIQSLDIDKDRLHIQGEVSTAEVARLMGEQHVFLLFSHYENLPCVIAEAHCTGMVVAGSDVGGTREMIDTRNGVIVQARDEEALFAKLNLVMDSLADYKPEKIREIAVTRYSYKSVGEAYVKVYQEALG